MFETRHHGESLPTRCEADDDDLLRGFPFHPCVPLQQVARVTPVTRGGRGLRVWRNFVEVIESRGYAPEPVGRYARSLRQLPRPLWPLPFRKFISEPLRSGGHSPWLGRKKQLLLNQIIQDLAETLTGTYANSEIPQRVRTAGLAEVEHRLRTMIDNPTLLGTSPLQPEIVPLILDELERDAGWRTRGLFTNRLLPPDPPITQTECAGRLGITRARYYQLLQQGRGILRFRWPEGPAILSALAHRAGQDPELERHEPLVEHLARELFGD